MAKWAVVVDDNWVSKDGIGYNSLDLSSIPSDVLALQSYDGIQADVEFGDRSTMRVSQNQTINLSDLTWWTSVESVYDAAVAAAEAAAAEEQPA